VLLAKHFFANETTPTPEYGDPCVCLSLDGRSGKFRVAEAWLIAQFLDVIP
jgi:hypothetical protein